VPSPASGRILLVATPISAVAVVLLGIVLGGEKPFRSARVYAGPTQGLSELSLRVELGERNRFVEAPIPDTGFVVSLVERGAPVAGARASGRTDPFGSAEVRLRMPGPREGVLELMVEPASGELGPPLARGLALGKTQSFLASATRRGGFQRGRHTGEIELAVAPARGVLMIAQGALDDELVIRAARGGSPVASARLSVKLEGAEPNESKLATDAQGLVKLRVRPQAGQLHVAIDAVADGIGEGTLAARLDVVQGAIRVSRNDERLLVESGGAANAAYLAFFDERARHLGMRVPLSAAADGRLVGEASWPPQLPATPLWVVASSQADLGSPSAVGWPIAGHLEPDPKTFDVRELLLLDGAPQAQKREERRAGRIRFVTAAYGALALLATLLLFGRRVRDADRSIERHLSRAGIDDAALSIAPVRKGRTWLAIACIGLGFVLLVVFVLYKD
jgi:hypothetical protein